MRFRSNGKELADFVVRVSILGKRDVDFSGGWWSQFCHSQTIMQMMEVKRLQGSEVVELGKILAESATGLIVFEGRTYLFEAEIASCISPTLDTIHSASQLL